MTVGEWCFIRWSQYQKGNIFKATEEGNILDEHEQWAKLRLIVEIAEEIWG